MTTEQILIAAGEARPDLMEKVAEALNELEQVDRDYAREALGEIKQVADYAVSAMEKTAAVSPSVAAAGRLAGRGAAVMGGMIAAGLAAAVATDLYDVAKRGLSKGTNYKRMMDGNPEMKQLDKSRLRASFDAVHRYAPEMTADPLVSGAAVRAVAELPGNEFTQIKALIDARKSLIESKHRQIDVKGPSAGMKDITGA